MKQHHQQQQKINGVTLRLTISVLLIILFMGCNDSNNKKKYIPSQIEEVSVLYLDFDLMSVIKISKEDFLYQHNRNKEINSVVINNNSQIEQFVHMIGSLQEAKELTKVNECDFYYEPIMSPSNRLHLINTYPLDIRCLILINDDNKYTPIWMSYHYIEIEGVFYKATDELRNWIRNAFR